MAPSTPCWVIHKSKRAPAVIVTLGSSCSASSAHAPETLCAGTRTRASALAKLATASAPARITKPDPRAPKTRRGARCKLSAPRSMEPRSMDSFMKALLS